MPKSSFFDTVTLPQGAVPGGMPQGAIPGGGPGMSFPSMAPSRLDPKLRAYYENVYGSKADVEWNPTTNRADVNVRAPVGDHQNQFFLNAGGYYQPSGTGTPSDYGVRLGFEKKIAPQGMSGGELLNRVLSQDPSVQSLGIQGQVIPASVRSGILSSLSPDKLKELSDQVREAQRTVKDEQLGIRPGATKFKYGIDFGGSSNQTNSDYAQVDPVDFARGYAGTLRQGQSLGESLGGSLADPNPQPGYKTPGINPDGEPAINPYTGEVLIKKERLMY